MTRVTAIVVTYNEAGNIGAALASLSFADEIRRRQPEQRRNGGCRPHLHRPQTSGRGPATSSRRTSPPRRRATIGFSRSMPTSVSRPVGRRDPQGLPRARPPVTGCRASPFTWAAGALHRLVSRPPAAALRSTPRPLVGPSGSRVGPGGRPGHRSARRNPALRLPRPLAPSADDRSLHHAGGAADVRRRADGGVVGPGNPSAGGISAQLRAPRRLPRRRPRPDRLGDERAMSA